MPKDDLRPEYDFAELGRAARSKYADAYRQGSNLVLLNEDVAKAFPDEKVVMCLLIKLTEQVGSTTPKP